MKCYVFNCVNNKISTCSIVPTINGLGMCNQQDDGKPIEDNEAKQFES